VNPGTAELDIAELGERVARALREENAGTLEQRIAVIAGRARTARLRALRRSSLYPETVTGPSSGNPDAESARPLPGPEAHP
jgi:hypothetical protein